MPLDHLYILLEGLPDSSDDWSNISWRVLSSDRADLIEKLPDKPWDWKGISNSRNLPLYLVEKYPDKPWDWEVFSRNYKIGMDVLRKFIDKPWDWSSISYQDRLDLDIVDKYPDKLWDWRGISFNKKLTINMIEKYPDKPWNWWVIMNNADIGLTMVEKHPDRPWDWRSLSKNELLTMNIVEKYPGKPWDWSEISRHKNLNMDIIEKYPNKPWNWHQIFYNSNFTLDILTKIPSDISNELQVSGVFYCGNYSIDKFLEYLALIDDVDPENKKPCRRKLNCISYDPQITMDIVKRFPNKPWNWDEIIDNPNFTIDLLDEIPPIAENNPYGKPWNWKKIIINCNKNNIVKAINKYLFFYGENSPVNGGHIWSWVSENKNITIDIIEKYVDKPLNWEKISENKNLSSEFIIKYRYKPWDLCDLISSFKSNENNAAVKIQRFYRKYGAFPRWKRGIKDTNIAILFNPEVKGTKFKEAEEEWNNRILLQEQGY